MNQMKRHLQQECLCLFVFADLNVIYLLTVSHDSDRMAL